MSIFKSVQAKKNIAENCLSFRKAHATGFSHWRAEMEIHKFRDDIRNESGEKEG